MNKRNRSESPLDTGPQVSPTKAPGRLTCDGERGVPGGGAAVGVGGDAVVGAGVALLLALLDGQEEDGARRKLDAVRVRVLQVGRHHLAVPARGG